MHKLQETTLVMRKNMTRLQHQQSERKTAKERAKINKKAPAVEMKGILIALELSRGTIDY